MTTVQSRSLRIRQFSIGPAHDPYGAIEFCYTCNGITTTLYRDGLLNIKVTHDDRKVFIGVHGYFKDLFIGDAEEEAERVFAELTGLTYNQFNRAYEKLNPPGLEFEDPMGSLASYM
jgi:hypothetical protein